MPFFIMTLPDTANTPLIGGARSMVVSAASSADAIAAAKSYVGWDADAAWATATATELTAGTDMTGIEIRLISASDADAYNRTFCYTGVASDTLNELLDGLAAAMNADTTTFPTTVTVSGYVLTIPAGNNLGDKAISCAVYKNGVAFASIGVAVSATGAEASARTVTLSGGTMAGSRLRLTVEDPTNPVDVSVFLHDGETIDLAAARLVVLANSTTLLSNVAYASNVITIPGASDAQGDKVITATWTREGVSLPELAPVVNAAGISSIDRTITFAADGTLPVPQPPKVLAVVKVTG